MTFALIVLAVLALAWANGANDNFKGVATLFGSGTTSYRGAIAWATATTLAGSAAAVVLAEKLLAAFSGRSVVGDALAGEPAFVSAVACGAGLTVLLATRLGLPVSTTHALVGALVGAGWSAGGAVNGEGVATQFFGPLLLSPVASIAATAAVYLALHQARRGLGITDASCVCVGAAAVPLAQGAAAAVAIASAPIELTTGTVQECGTRYGGRVLGLDAAAVVDRLHYVSAGIVSFARGLNDTPKIAALLLIVPAFDRLGGTAAVAAAIAVGGLVGARRVADVMSRKITTMNHGQGFTANLMTGVLVIGASRMGLPVSTTHVSCGALFGIGAVHGRADWRMIARILAAWLTTLPLGAALGAIAYRLTP